MHLFDSFKPSIEPADSCKGLFFRGSVNQYFSIRGGLRVVATRQVKFLKKKSCTGCNTCGWFWDAIGEEAYNSHIDLNHLEHGKMYEAVFVEDSRDWETGIVDDWRIEFREGKGD